MTLEQLKRVLERYPREYQARLWSELAPAVHAVPPMTDEAAATIVNAIYLRIRYGKEPPINDGDTAPLRSYEDIMQQQAYKAFEQLRHMIPSHLTPGVTPVDWMMKAEFWESLMKVLEYAVLKNPPK